MKYNHMFDVAFTVKSKERNWKDITYEELIEGLIKRLPALYKDGIEAFGFHDTIELEVTDEHNR